MHSHTRANIYMIFLLAYRFLLLILSSLFVKYFSSNYVFFGKYNLSVSLIVSQVLMSALPMFFYLMLTHKKVKDLLPFKLLSLKNALLIILICIFIQPTMMLLSFISGLTSGNPVDDLLSGMVSLPFFITLFTVGVVPAIFEEITFRGVILSEYKNVPLKTAFFINGLFFGIMHLQLQQFLYAALLGILFSYFVHSTKSILSSMLGHFVINGSQVLLLYLTYSVQSVDTDLLSDFSSSEILFSQFIFVSIFVLITLPIVYLFLKIFHNNNKNNVEANLGEEIIVENDFHEKKPKVYTWSFWVVILFFIFFMLAFE